VVTVAASTCSSSNNSHRRVPHARAPRLPAAVTRREPYGIVNTERNAGSLVAGVDLPWQGLRLSPSDG